MSKEIDLGLDGWVVKRSEKIIEPAKEIDVAQSIDQEAKLSDAEEVVQDQSENPKSGGISLPPPQPGWQH